MEVCIGKIVFLNQIFSTVFYLSKFIRLNGRPMVPSSHFEIHGTGPVSSLIITPSGERDYTSYRCVATNILGIVEHGIELKKAYPPDVVQQVRHYCYFFPYHV